MRKLFVFDYDPARRIAIFKAIHGAQYHVEPFDACIEMSRYLQPSSIVLVAQNGGWPEICDLLKADRLPWCLKILVYSEKLILKEIVAAMRSGASGYLEFPLSAEDLDQALDQALVGSDLGGAKVPQPNEFTARESQLANELISAASIEEIAVRLGISTRTVERHQVNMRRKVRRKIRLIHHNSSHLGFRSPSVDEA